MITVFSRTVIIYVVLLFAMRLMGKRQIGEMQSSELVTTLLLSELAVGPITNKNLPILHAIISIFLLLSLEVITSFALTKSNLLKKLLYGAPTILIRDGIVNIKALVDNRIEIDELMSELRQKNAPDISSVKYAILEDNGKLSVFLKSDKSPPTSEDLNLSHPDGGIAHEMIIDGEIVEENLTLMGKDRNWLSKQLSDQNISLSDVFLFTLNDAEESNIIIKDTNT